MKYWNCTSGSKDLNKASKPAWRDTRETDDQIKFRRIGICNNLGIIKKNTGKRSHDQLSAFMIQVKNSRLKQVDSIATLHLTWPECMREHACVCVCVRVSQAAVTSILHDKLLSQMLIIIIQKKDRQMTLAAASRTHTHHVCHPGSNKDK